MSDVQFVLLSRAPLALSPTLFEYISNLGQHHLIHLRQVYVNSYASFGPGWGQQRSLEIIMQLVQGQDEWVFPRDHFRSEQFFLNLKSRIATLSYQKELCQHLFSGLSGKMTTRNQVIIFNVQRVATICVTFLFRSIWFCQKLAAPNNDRNSHEFQTREYWLIFRVAESATIKKNQQ